MAWQEPEGSTKPVFGQSGDVKGYLPHARCSCSSWFWRVITFLCPFSYIILFRQKKSFFAEKALANITFLPEIKFSAALVGSRKVIIILPDFPRCVGIFVPDNFFWSISPV